MCLCVTHVKFEQYDWLRIINLTKIMNDPLSTDILSMELHTEIEYLSIEIQLFALIPAASALTLFLTLSFTIYLWNEI
jgi:hypothetical protein